MRVSSIRRFLGLLVVLGAISACGSGGGGGGASIDPNAPVINNVRTSFGASCLVNAVPGTATTIAFDYADADGDVRGGTVEATATFGVGGASTLTAPIPSPNATITGTTSGTIAVTGCLRFGSNPSFRGQVKITDASGKSSNTLTADVPNPGGLPLGPRDGNPAGHWSL